MHPYSPPALASLLAMRILDSFQVWLLADGECLIDAAELLGGAPWKERAFALLGAVEDDVPLVDLTNDLTDLFRLLSLDLVDDLDSLEAELFLEVHPDDPRADNARICAEALNRGLEAIKIVASEAARQTSEAA